MLNDDPRTTRSYTSFSYRCFRSTDGLKNTHTERFSGLISDWIVSIKKGNPFIQCWVGFKVLKKIKIEKKDIFFVSGFYPWRINYYSSTNNWMSDLTHVERKRRRTWTCEVETLTPTLRVRTKEKGKLLETGRPRRPRTERTYSTKMKHLTSRQLVWFPMWWDEEKRELDIVRGELRNGNELKTSGIWYLQWSWQMTKGCHLSDQTPVPSNQEDRLVVRIRLI